MTERLLDNNMLSNNGASPINIWKGTVCNASVKLTPYLVPGVGNPGCIICPGGSYFWLSREREGHGVAKWLQSMGISAFVLEYRVAGVTAFVTRNRFFRRGVKYPDMLEDLQRSIQLVRENAEIFGINPNELGVMGFSAGGHLAALSGIYFDRNKLARFDITPKISLRPDFIASLYPVISMVDKSTHKRSRRGLLGDKKKGVSKMKEILSLEKHVRKDMPPIFLMNCKDDPIVNYRNSELFARALKKKRVHHKYIQFETGGHGFGTDPLKTSNEAISWCEEFSKWIKEILK